jgi:hypothetical protein
MLKKIERYPAAFIDGHNFAIEKRIGWEPFASRGNMRELVGEGFPLRDQSVTPSFGTNR